MSEPVAKLKINIDAEQFRKDLEAMVDEITERAAQSLDVRIRMIVRDEMDKQSVDGAIQHIVREILRANIPEAIREHKLRHG